MLPHPTPTPVQQEAGECSRTAAEASVDEWRQGVSVPEEENTIFI